MTNENNTTHFCIRESLPLGDMGDWLGLTFETESDRDSVYDTWMSTYLAGRCTGQPVKENRSYPIGYEVSDVGYWMKRLA